MDQILKKVKMILLMQNYQNLLTDWRKPLKIFLINLISISCLLIFSYVFIQKTKNKLKPKPIEDVNTQLNDKIMPKENNNINENSVEKITENLTEDSFYDSDTSLVNNSKTIKLTVFIT